MTGAVSSSSADASSRAQPLCQAHTAETEKMLNLDKSSDDQEKKEEKKQTDPVALHGEDTGTSRRVLSWKYIADVLPSTGDKSHATEVDGPHEDKPTKVVD